MKRFFLLWGVMCVALVAQAQYVSRLGRFQVDQIRGCAPFTITITNTNLVTTGDCTPGKPCIMSFDGTTNCPPNTSCQNIFQFTYTTPGTYKLSVLYQSLGSDDITVTVDSNTAPPFDVYTCAGSKVFVNITDKVYDSYSIDFNNDGTVDTAIPSGLSQTATYSYGAAGNYTISVKGKKLNAANNCLATTHPFTAIATLPTPTINTLTATDVSTLQLAYIPQTNIEYHADFAINNASNFQQYQTLYGVSSLTVPNLNVDKNYYCFRLGSFDPCANINTYSSSVCSQAFSVTSVSGAEQLSWQTESTGITNIQISRNTAPLTSVTGTATSYSDNAVICKTNYCYQLVSKYPGGTTSTSLQKCATSFLTTTPTAISNTSAVVSDDATKVDLSWLQDPAFTAASYLIFKSQNGGSFTLDNTTTAKQYTDNTYSPGYCYRINYTDNCDNASAQGLASCPMHLSGTNNETNEAVLQWSSYKGWNQGVKNYTIQKFNQQGHLIQTITSVTDTSYIDTQQDQVNQVVIYKIIANANEAGVSSSSSNEVRIVKSVNLFYPTAFNPESKVATGNRTFTVKGHFVSKLEIQIFDRWGSLVFYSDKNEAWDGRKDGNAMPDATYVWTAEGTDLIGNSFKKAGTVVLIRK
ncbi:MAG: gliding motility-associated C-terminal domain-containing protein [Bacteroidetes bacterium]|nr:gliding motility-associated C-terminal domain-containing protein [Bacteroidota bacterium]